MSTTGVRATRQRAPISASLENLDEFRSAQEIHDELRRRGEGIGLTTVYRTCSRWPPTSSSTRCARHRRVGVPALLEHHHHHLVCRACGSTVEIQGGDVEAWLPRSPRRTASPRSATPSRSSASAALRGRSRRSWWRSTKPSTATASAWWSATSTSIRLRATTGRSSTELADAAGQARRTDLVENLRRSLNGDDRVAKTRPPPRHFWP